MGSPSVRHIVVILAGTFLLAGCDPVTRHKVLSTVFDGVPSLPPPEELCQEYVEKEKSRPAGAGAPSDGEAPKATGSVHSPYAEKLCNDCHDADKKMEGGLLKPKNELCFMCHPDILKRPWSHGPAAVGDCLACHLPHEANFPSLLVKERTTLCDKCHLEERLATAMHNKVKAEGITCVDCHDPHSGNSNYFLK